MSTTKVPGFTGAAGDPSLGAASARRPCILLVDDQPARLLTYESVLSGLEVHCIKALSGEEALKKLLEQEFAVILLDVNMPGMDGFEVARAIREHPRLERTPIIFVTGVNVGELDRLKGYEVGAIDYIEVPVVPEILRSKVAVLTELYQRRQALIALNRELSEARARAAREHAQTVAAPSEGAAVRESRQRLLLANRAARLGTHDWQIEAGIITWDERTYELWGIRPGEPVTYELFVDGLHPEDRARTQAAVDRALDPKGDGQYTATFRVISRADGRTRWVEAHGEVLFENGRAHRLVGTVRDVTDQTLAAERIRESEERFRELANHIDQFAWSCDELGQGTWYNQRWYDYTGTTYEQMQGAGWARVLHPEHLPRVIAGLRHCAAAGKPWEDTFPLRGKDGRYRWFLSRAAPIRSEDGRIRRWLGTNTDVTELRELQDALEAADRRKDEFLAMLAHELRNPVAPIASAAEVLSRLVTADSKARGCVEVIQRQSRHLSRLLDDLLDVARVTQRRVVLRRELVPLSSCVEQAIETAEPLMREKGQQLTIVRERGPLLVNVDRVRMAQSIGNLLINAAKYTDRGGNIKVTLFVEGSHSVVEVKDTGVGIPAELLPRVFDLFVQGSRPLDRAEGGLGIGLAMCRDLVEMHGGSVTAASPGPNEGATFTIRLPLAEGTAESARVQPVTAPSRRILILDDNRDAADTLKILLESEGHETLALYAAADALEQAGAFKPDVVLLDIGLPGMDGYEVARRMRGFIPAARLIALSGYGQPEDKQRSSAAGFDGHLVKPVEADALKRILAESHGREAPRPSSSRLDSERHG